MKEQKYKVVKIMRLSERREILNEDLTREEAKRIVNQHPNKPNSMVVFMKQAPFIKNK